MTGAALRPRGLLTTGGAFPSGRIPVTGSPPTSRSTGDGSRLCRPDDLLAKEADAPGRGGLVATEEAAPDRPGVPALRAAPAHSASPRPALTLTRHRDRVPARCRLSRRRSHGAGSPASPDALA
ncbi:hypothetical protein GCM10027168_32620 [Streptomyces capparidis]